MPYNFALASVVFKVVGDGCAFAAGNPSSGGLNCFRWNMEAAFQDVSDGRFGCVQTIGGIVRTDDLGEIVGSLINSLELIIGLLSSILLGDHVKDAPVVPKCDSETSFTLFDSVPQFIRSNLNYGRYLVLDFRT